VKRAYLLNTTLYRGYKIAFGTAGCVVYTFERSIMRSVVFMSHSNMIRSL
jgi:hypothetical protein